MWLARASDVSSCALVSDWTGEGCSRLLHRRRSTRAGRQCVERARAVLYGEIVYLAPTMCHSPESPTHILGSVTNKSASWPWRSGKASLAGQCSDVNHFDLAPSPLTALSQLLLSCRFLKTTSSYSPQRIEISDQYSRRRVAGAVAGAGVVSVAGLASSVFCTVSDKISRMRSHVSSWLFPTAA